MYQSENGLGFAAFPSIAEMEADVISCGLRLLNAPEDAVGNMTSGGTESIILAVKACRDQARAAGRRILVSGADGLRDHIEAGAIGVQDSSVSKWTAALEGILHSPVQTLPADCAEVAEADFVMAWRSLVADLKHNSGSTRTVSTQTEAA